jgi:DNA-binding MarR family transcriptional regulator
MRIAKKYIPKKDRKLNSVSLLFHEKLLNDKNLSTCERFLLALVSFRDSTPRGCFATNKSLGEFLNCSPATISKTVTALKLKGYIISNEPDPENGGRVNIRKVCPSLKKLRPD